MVVDTKLVSEANEAFIMLFAVSMNDVVLALCDDCGYSDGNCDIVWVVIKVMIRM